jgi:excisionase family DNA binding protein
MAAAVDEVTVRQAARRAGRSEETIRRWIWSGRLPAVKRGTSYRIDVRHLEEVIVEIDLKAREEKQAMTAPLSMQEWLDEVDEWKRNVVSRPGPSASEMLIEDRHARR